MHDLLSANLTRHSDAIEALDIDGFLFKGSTTLTMDGVRGPQDLDIEAGKYNGRTHDHALMLLQEMLAASAEEIKAALHPIPLTTHSLEGQALFLTLGMSDFYLSKVFTREDLEALLSNGDQYRLAEQEKMELQAALATDAEQWQTVISIEYIGKPEPTLAEPLYDRPAVRDMNLLDATLRKMRALLKERHYASPEGHAKHALDLFLLTADDYGPYGALLKERDFFPVDTNDLLFFKLLIAQLATLPASTLDTVPYEFVEPTAENIDRTYTGLLTLERKGIIHLPETCEVSRELAAEILANAWLQHERALGIVRDPYPSASSYTLTRVGRHEERFFMDLRRGTPHDSFGLPQDGNLPTVDAYIAGALDFLSDTVKNEGLRHETARRIAELALYSQNSMPTFAQLHESKDRASPLQTALRKITIGRMLKSFTDTVSEMDIQLDTWETSIRAFKLKGSSVMGYGEIRAPSDIDIEVIQPVVEETSLSLKKTIGKVITQSARECRYDVYEAPPKSTARTDRNKVNAAFLGKQCFYIHAKFKDSDLAEAIRNPERYHLNEGDLGVLLQAIGTERTMETVITFDSTCQQLPSVFPPHRSPDFTGDYLSEIVIIDERDAIANKLVQVTRVGDDPVDLAKSLMDIYLMTSRPSGHRNALDERLENSSSNRIPYDDPMLRKALFFCLFEKKNTQPLFGNFHFGHLNPNDETCIAQAVEGLRRLQQSGVIHVPGIEIDEAFARQLIGNAYAIYHAAFGLHFEAGASASQGRLSADRFTPSETHLIDKVANLYSERWQVMSPRLKYDTIYTQCLALADPIASSDKPERFAERMAWRIIKVEEFGRRPEQHRMDAILLPAHRTQSDTDRPRFAIWVKSTNTSSHLKTALLFADALQQEGMDVTIISDAEARERAAWMGYRDVNFVVVPSVPNMPEDGTVIPDEMLEARQTALEKGTRILMEARRREKWDGFATELWPTAMGTHNDQLIRFMEDAFEDKEHPMMTYCIGRDIPGRNKTADAGGIMNLYLTRLLQGNDPSLRRITEDIPSAAHMDETGRVTYVGFYGAKCREKAALAEEEKEILVVGGASFKANSQEFFTSALDMYPHLPAELPCRTLRLVVDRNSSPESFVELVRHAIHRLEPRMPEADRERLIQQAQSDPNPLITLAGGRIILQGLMQSEEYDRIMSRAAVIYTRGGMCALEGAKANIGVVGFPVKEAWERDRKVEQEKRMEMLANAKIGDCPLAEIVSEEIVRAQPQALAGKISRAYFDSITRQTRLNGQEVPIMTNGFESAASVIRKDMDALRKGDVKRADKPGCYVYSPSLLPHAPQPSQQSYL